MNAPLRYRLIDLVRGTNALDVLARLRVEQYWPEEALRAASALRRDDYFAALRRDVPLFRATARFEDLPVTDKAYVNLHRHALRNPHYRGRVLRKKTSGSTGNPMIYHTGTPSQSWLWAGLFLSWEVAGHRLGEPIAYLTGAPGRQGLALSGFYRLMNVEILSAFDMAPARMDAYLAALRTRGYRFLYGYASAVHRLAVHALEKAPRVRTTLRGIVCTGETMDERMRHTVELAFGVPCFRQYGCNEAGVSAFECEHRSGYHLLTPRCHAEVLADGRLVSTDLTNRAMYLPRHDTGDLVRMSGRRCPCGRGLPLIDDVLGRQYDFIVDPAGRAVHYQLFMFLLREDLRVHSFQAVYDDDSLELNLHTGPLSPLEQAEMARFYSGRLRAALAFPRIACVFNRPYVRHPNGKHRFLLRRPEPALA